MTSVQGPVLTVRAASGLSGDMMLAGMAVMAGVTQDDLDALVASLGLPSLSRLPDAAGREGTDCTSRAEHPVRLETRSVHEVAGWGCVVDLPHEHAHRSLIDIQEIIRASSLAPEAAALAMQTFSLLATAEGAVHGKEPQAVTFHEVGALDSIVDICLVCALFVRLAPVRFVCSPLPVADGGVLCAHGWLPTPAPAVMRLLEGVPVRPFAGTGETVTPTAIALLKALGAVFAPWPSMTIARQALVYGTKVFENAPNGSIWAYGPAESSRDCPKV